MFYTDRYNLQRYNFNPGNLQTCSGSQPTVNIGHYQKSKTLVFYCGDSTCGCHKTQTTEFSIKSIVDGLKNKESEGWEPYQQIVRYYNGLINSLEKERDKLLAKMKKEQAKRLCEDEENLLKYLDEGIGCWSGKYEWKEGIKLVLGESQKERIKKELTGVQKEFMEFSLKIRRMWQESKDMPSWTDFIESREQMSTKILLEDLQTNTAVQSVKIGNKLVKASEVKQNDLYGITEVTVDQINIKTLSCLILHCPKINTYTQIPSSLNLQQRITEGSSSTRYQIFLTLSQLQNIRKITITLESINTNKTLALLSSKFPLLSDLDIRTLNLENDSLDILSQNQSKFAKLSLFISLSPTKSTLNPLASLTKFVNLQYLKLHVDGYVIKQNELSFQNFKRLQGLEIQIIGNPMDNSIYKTISKIESLKQLVLEKFLEENTMQSIAEGCVNLEKIKTLVKSQYHFRNIGKMKSLKKIMLDQINGLKDSNLEDICKGVRELEHLELNVSFYFNVNSPLEELTHVGVSNLSKFKTTLKYLSLNNLPLCNRSAMVIGLNLPSLQQLYLRQTKIQDSGYSYLSKLRSLVKFEIGQKQESQYNIKYNDNRGSKFRYNLRKLKEFKFLSPVFEDRLSYSSLYQKREIFRSLKNELVFQMNSEVNVGEVEGVKVKGKIWLEVSKETLELNNYLRYF